MYEEIAEASRYARECGLVVVIWSYARGAQLSKEGETAVDVICYAAQVAAQLGAHIIKVKPPTDFVEQKENKAAIEKNGVKISSMSDRIKLVLQSSFNGKRIVIFSGGEAKGEDAILEEVKGIAQGGGFGSIMGRNAFQRPKKESIELLHKVMDIFAK